MVHEPAQDRTPDERGAQQAFVQARALLHEALAGDDTDKVAWLQNVREAVATLRETLDHHRTVSEVEGGILRDVVLEKPPLLPESVRLAHEHDDMLIRARAIEVEIDRELAFEEYKLDLVRLEAEVLHAILHLHLVRADWLVYEAYFRTEGGEEG